MKISSEVAAAKESARPLVALESTLISHGLPFPDNVEVAKAAENAVRENGATPATMAVIDNVAHVGLEDAEMQRLATADGVIKLSRQESAGLTCRHRACWQRVGVKSPWCHNGVCHHDPGAKSRH